MVLNMSVNSVKHIHVLLVEDNPADEKLFRLMLKNSRFYQFTITAFDTLKSALDTMAEENYDIIVSDLTLPDSIGWETIRDLIRTQTDIPIVLLTGIEDEQLEIRAIQSGIESYLNKKNLNAELVFKTILHALERHRLKDLWKKSELQFQRIIQQSGDGVLVLDKEGTILYANPTAEKFFHTSAEELIGEILGIPVTTNNLSELSLLDLEQKELNVEIQVTHIEWEKQPAYLVTLRDVTHRKEIEAITKEKDLLEKIRFLSGAIAHEFAQPLQIIGHALELYVMENGSSERLNVCKINLERTTKLVRQLQNINTVETKPYLNSEILDIEASSKEKADLTFPTKKNKWITPDTK